MKLSIQLFASLFLFLFLSFFSQWAEAFSFNTTAPLPPSPITKFVGNFQGGPFSLVPFGNLPTTVVTGLTTTAYYTVTNNTSRTLPDCQVQTIPRNTTRVTTGAGICGDRFTLASHESCQVELTISGAVNNLPPLFVCDSYNTSCSGNRDFPLNVTPISLVSLTVTPVNLSLNVGQDKQYVATATYSDGTTADVTHQVTWSSSDTRVASVASTGLVRAISTGTSTISASLLGVTGSTTVFVQPKRLSSITVTPTFALVSVGFPIQYKAIGTYSDGSTADITNTATWASSNTGRATISNTSGSQGLATGVSAGDVAISATLNGQTGSTGLTVTAATVEAVLVSDSASIAKGTTHHFIAIAIYSDLTIHDVTSIATWGSSDTTVATIETAGDADPGLATGLTEGSARITATVQGKSNGTPNTILTVTPATLQSIAVTPSSPSVPVGASEHFIATGTYSDSTTQNITSSVTWSSSNTSVATIGATTGIAEALSAGNTTVTASLSGVSGHTNMNVSAVITLTSIAVTPTDKTRSNGTSLDYTATGTYSDGSHAVITDSVTWLSSNTSVATISDITGSKGRATVADLATTGAKTTISATSGSLVGTTTLTAGGAALLSISVTPSGQSVAKGDPLQFKATGSYTDGIPRDLTDTAHWSVTTSPAIGTISSTGLFTATASSGSGTVTASVGAVSGTATVSDTAAVITSIVVTPPNQNVPKASTQAYTATAYYSDSTHQDVTTSSTWSSSDVSVATISNASGTKGVATALTLGSTTITALYNTYSGHTTMTVTGPLPRSLAVTPTAATVPIGETHPFAATVTFADGSTQVVTTSSSWSSSNTTVATIGASTGIATALVLGTSNITASYTDPVSGVTVSNVLTPSVLTATAAALTSIAVTPTAISVPQGKSTQFTAMGTYSDTSTQDITDSVTWASSATSVATISNTPGSQGVATAVGSSGTSNITASLQGVTSTPAAVFTAAAPVCTSIAVTPANSAIIVGGTENLIATCTMSHGATTNVTTTSTWSSNNNTIATVGASTGLVTGASVGATSIKAVFTDAGGTTTGQTTSFQVAPQFMTTVGLLGTEAAPLGALAYTSNTSGAFSYPINIANTAYQPDELNGVSCIGTTKNCVAVGSSTNGSEGLVYTSSNAGVAWTPVQAPLAGVTFMIGVSCMSNGTCEAVGNELISGQFQPIVFQSTDSGLHWNTGQVLNIPAGTINTYARGVACYSSLQVCEIVGVTYNDSGTHWPVAYNYQGGQWSGPIELSSIVINGTIPATSAEFESVTYSSDQASFIAVGNFTSTADNQETQPFFSETNSVGSSFNFFKSLPYTGGFVYMRGVACSPTESSCLAVGSVNDETPLLYYSPSNGLLNASSVTLALPSGATVGELAGVTCAASQGYCAAVGGYTLNGSQLPISYSTPDGGSTWNSLSTAPGGAVGSLLSVATEDSN